jgi:hypothetical protein
LMSFVFRLEGGEATRDPARQLWRQRNPGHRPIEQRPGERVNRRESPVWTFDTFPSA